MSAISPESTVVLQIDGLHIAHLRLVLRDWSTEIYSGVTLVCDEEVECKTDFLRLLAAELPYAAGDLTLLGVAQHVDVSAYRQQVFWIEPSATEYDEFTVEGFFSWQASRYAGFDQTVLLQLIEGLALGPHLFKQIQMLSSGTRRKVWISAAFASGAALTLLDDPLAALDKSSALFVLSQMAALAQDGQRALVVGDYQALANVPLAARIDLGG
ncbi:ATP-binding cassette domain-containing protein [Undibacterium sp. FT79W]|uniref:ABC transporter ATP-binding protein n=1 Tax=Undibacterium sp. FT79W TaxID=2762296 RepID=UPI0021025A64|nr:ATP-binding cassette domain-containing protein [Undibacterium sp. FT79W]